MTDLQNKDDLTYTDNIRLAKESISAHRTVISLSVQNYFYDKFVKAHDFNYK